VILAMVIIAVAVAFAAGVIVGFVMGQAEETAGRAAPSLRLLDGGAHTPPSSQLQPRRPAPGS
jgi:hypothetical protein